MVGAAARDLWVGTFHAMCVRMLRRDGSKIGIARNFAIMDDTDQRADRPRHPARSRLSTNARSSPGARAGRDLQGEEQPAGRPTSTKRSTRRSSASATPQVYREYERRLAESNGLDFDDLIVAHDRAARERRRRRATATSRSSTTSSSTSIRTSTPRSTSSSRCWPTSTRTSRSSATTISRSTRGAAATIA